MNAKTKKSEIRGFVSPSACQRESNHPCSNISLTLFIETRFYAISRHNGSMNERGCMSFGNAVIKEAFTLSSSLLIIINNRSRRVSWIGFLIVMYQIASVPPCRLRATIDTEYAKEE